MILTDTHTHLYSEEFDQDRDEMIRRALDAHVERFFLPAIDSSAHQSMKDLADRYPQHIYMMMGLHPVYVKPDSWERELEIVTQELQTGRYVAVGEIGIDLYWDQSTLEIQKQAFRYQIGLAKSLKLPINIHCREAFDEIFEILESEKSPELFGIFHCFTGNQEQAQQAISYGMKLGIGGVATFKNGKIDTFLNQIDLKHIVLETDSPYLAPAPFRGKRNESAYVALVANKLAEIYGIETSAIAQITTQNSREIYGI